MSNSNQPNISKEQLDKMLNLASGRLGISPGQLKNILNDKKATDDLLGRIGGQDKLNSAMKNPEVLSKFLNENPKAKKLLNEILGDNKNG